MHKGNTMAVTPWPRARVSNWSKHKIRLQDSTVTAQLVTPEMAFEPFSAAPVASISTNALQGLPSVTRCELASTKQEAIAAVVAQTVMLMLDPLAA